MVLVPGGPWGDYVAFRRQVDLQPAAVLHRPVRGHEPRLPGVRRQRRLRERRPTGSSRSCATGRSSRGSDAMALFRDSTGRAGPSTWSGGHYPEGKGDYPVSGVSWFEAAAYAEFRGKSLPVIAQFWKTTPNITDKFIQPLSNDSQEPRAGRQVRRSRAVRHVRSSRQRARVVLERDRRRPALLAGPAHGLVRSGGVVAIRPLGTERLALRRRTTATLPEETRAPRQAAAARLLEGGARERRRVRGLPRHVRLRQDAARRESRSGCPTIPSIGHGRRSRSRPLTTTSE